MKINWEENRQNLRRQTWKLVHSNTLQKSWAWFHIRGHIWQQVWSQAGGQVAINLGGIDEN